MAEWSKMLPLTTPCPSTPHRFESQPGTWEENASDFVLGGGFSDTPVSCITNNWLITN